MNRCPRVDFDRVYREGSQTCLVGGAGAPSSRTWAEEDKHAHLETERRSMFQPRIQSAAQTAGANGALVPAAARRAQMVPVSWLRAINASRGTCLGCCSPRNSRS